MRELFGAWLAEKKLDGHGGVSAERREMPSAAAQQLRPLPPVPVLPK